jgi:hypothetical protein
MHSLLPQAPPLLFLSPPAPRSPAAAASRALPTAATTATPAPPLPQAPLLRTVPTTRVWAVAKKSAACGRVKYHPVAAQSGQHRIGRAAPSGASAEHRLQACSHRRTPCQ